MFRELPHRVTAVDIKSCPIGPGESVVIHRGICCPGHEHTDDVDCWCSPMVWTLDDVEAFPLDAIEQRLRQFFCVH